VYAEPSFRGARVAVKSLFDFVLFSFPGEPLVPPSIGQMGSIAGEVGLPGPNLDTLIRTRNCDRRNFESADLHGRDLSNVSLRSADLQHAELTGTVLSNAHAEAANFQSANLTGAILRGAHLEGANFESAGPVPFMTEAYPAAELSGADCSGA